MRFLIFGEDEHPMFSVQLFNSPPEPISFEDMLKDSLKVDIAGVDAVICSRDHLVEMKKLAWRIQDRDDVEALTLIESLGDSLSSQEAINELISKEEGSFARERLQNLYEFNKLSSTERADWVMNMLKALGSFT